MASKTPFRRRIGQALRAAGMKRSADVWAALVGASTNNTYAGAQGGRLTMDWVRQPIEADKAIQGKLGLLRERARDLARNDAHAANALRLYADNVVGPTGITLQCRVVNRQGNLDKATNAAVESGFHTWSRAPFCTVNGKHSWVEVQRYAIQLALGEGEALIQLVEHAQEPFGFALKLLDADRLDETYMRPAGNGLNEIRMSVELDRDERPVAYHFLRQHPNGIANMGQVDPNDRIRIPANQLIHLFETPRIGQTRGMTRFASIMMNLRMLQGYQEAEVIAARISASKVGVIYTDPAVWQSAQYEAPEGAEPQTVDIDPGSFYKPLPGERIEGWSPDHPTQQYRDFVKGQLQSVGAGLGLSYQSLSGDLEGTSFSSGRTGLLQERDHYRALQGWLIEHLHSRVFERWLAWASLMGVVPREKVAAVQESIVWQPRGWDWVDPKNEVDATYEEVKIGLTSRTRSLAERGVDIEDVFAELAAEKQLAKEFGIEIVESPTNFGEYVNAPAPGSGTTPAGDGKPARSRKKAA